MRRLIVLWLLVGLSAASACEVHPLGTVALDESTPNLIVWATINGTEIPLILDTGAQRTVLDAAMVERLHVARDTWVATTMRGVGGDERQRNALPRAITLGGIPLRPRSVAPGLSLPVGHLAFGSVRGRPVGGLLGADLLGGFDLMLNGPGHALTLFAVAGCTGGFLPWPIPYAPIPTIRPVGDILLVPVRIDGTVLLAQLDSGAAHSLIMAPGMAKLGLTAAMLRDDPSVQTRGVGPDNLIVHRHRFATMAIGDDMLAHPELWVGDAHGLRIVDMLLGVDWLRPRLVWLSYATSQIFVAQP